MKAKNFIILKLAVLLGYVWIVGCSSGGQDTAGIRRRRTETVSDIGMKELGGDIDARLKRSKVYTEYNTLLSNLNGSEVKERCEFDAKKDYHDWGKMLRTGFACVNKGDWNKVEEIGQSFSIRHVDAPWGAYFLSLSSEKAGDMPRSFWMIGLADRKSPDNAIIEFQKARLLWLKDQRDASFQAAKKALMLDPKLTEAALLMAQVYFSDYDFDNAQKYFRSVLNANQDNFQATLGMAESFAQLDKHKDAIPFYISAIKIKRNRIDLAYALADIYETKMKDYKRALEWYEKISQVFPKEVVSKEKTEVTNKITFLTAKIEEGKNAGKAQANKKADVKAEKREPAANNGQQAPEAQTDGVEVKEGEQQ